MLPLGIIDAVNAVPTAASGISDVHHSLRVEYRTLYRRSVWLWRSRLYQAFRSPNIYSEVRHWKIRSHLKSMSEV
jgi:hypothetical protein